MYYLHALHVFHCEVYFSVFSVTFVVKQAVLRVSAPLRETWSRNDGMVLHSSVQNVEREKSGDRSQETEWGRIQ